MSCTPMSAYGVMLSGQEVLWSAIAFTAMSATHSKLTTATLNVNDDLIEDDIRVTFSSHGGLRRKLAVWSPTAI